MTALPGSTALTTIADGSLIVAADHRNNYTAIQTQGNGFVTALSGGTAKQVLTALSSSSVDYEFPPGYEYAYAEVATDVSITATVEASATTIVTAASVTFDGATLALFEFFCPAVAGSAVVDFRFVLFDGSSPVGFLSEMRFVTTGVPYPAVLAQRRTTPSAGAHVFSVRGFSGSAATVTAHGGTSAAGAYAPLFLRVTKV